MDNLDFKATIMISIIITVIILLLTGLALYHVQSHTYEYGHVLKLKEIIYEHKKDIEANTVKIQVAKFTTFFGLMISKIKVYSDYFEILKNNKQKAKYQNILKDIAIIWI